MQHRLADLPDPGPKRRKHIDWRHPQGTWPTKLHHIRMPKPLDFDKLISAPASYEYCDDIAAHRLAIQIAEMRYKIWGWHELLGDKDSI